MAQVIWVIVAFGVVALAVTAWTWYRIHEPWGALVAFCLGPAWGAFIYSIAFCRDGGPDAGLLFGFSLGIGGVFVGIPCGLFFAFIQFLARNDYDTRRDNDLRKDDELHS
jgi:hypothetical protein